MLSGSSSSWDRKILRRLRETLAYTGSNYRVQLFLKAFLQNRPEANIQWFPLGAEGPHPLVSESAVFPTTSMHLRINSNRFGFLLVFL